MLFTFHMLFNCSPNSMSDISIFLIFKLRKEMFFTQGQKPGKWKNVLLSLQVKVKEGMQGEEGRKASH